MNLRFTEHLFFEQITSLANYSNNNRVLISELKMDIIVFTNLLNLRKSKLDF